MQANQQNVSGPTKLSSPGNGVSHIRNLNDLQRILCDQIEGVIAGSATPQNVNAITNAAGKVISISKMKLEVAKAAGRAFEAEDLTRIEDSKEPKGKKAAKTT